MGEQMKRFLQAQANKEAERIMDEVNQDPSLQNVEAPDAIHDALFAQIDAYEDAKAHEVLSEEERELIELGKRFKKNRRVRRHIAAVFAAVCIVGVTGITAMGGPERLMEKVEWMLAGRTQTNVDSDHERVEDMSGVSEAEAWAKIEEEFGFIPVKMYYLPGKMRLKNCEMVKEIQYINMIYQDKESNVLMYMIYPNYKTSSLGRDIEDILVEEYEKIVGDTAIHVGHYWVEDNSTYRWTIDFIHDGTYYRIRVSNVEHEEIDKIIGNLYFS